MAAQDKEEKQIKANFQFCPPLSDFTHLVVPRTFSQKDRFEICVFL